MIKRQADDFIVEEKSTPKLSDQGEYRAYLLQKRHWNTLDLLGRLSRDLGLPLPLFSYGGKKDKHGLTRQLVAIRDQRDWSRRGENFSLQALGFMERPMGPDLIRGNQFQVCLRSLARLEPILTNLPDVTASGFANFFDEQRFRSWDPQLGFFAEKIALRHFNGALKVYLTSRFPGLSKTEKERRAKLESHWHDWKLCQHLASGPLENRIFARLIRNQRAFSSALELIPLPELSMLYSSFQSHLWNELLRELIRNKVSSYQPTPGREGPYLFWTGASTGHDYLQKLEIPTAAASMTFPDDLVASLFAEILAKRGLKPSSFRTKVLSKAYFKSIPRPATVFPENLEIVSQGIDVLHPGRRQLTLSFFLPRGVYATMLIKRICLRG